MELKIFTKVDLILIIPSGGIPWLSHPIVGTIGRGVFCKKKKKKLPGSFRIDASPRGMDCVSAEARVQTHLKSSPRILQHEDAPL